LTSARWRRASKDCLSPISCTASRSGAAVRIASARLPSAVRPRGATPAPEQRNHRPSAPARRYGHARKRPEASRGYDLPRPAGCTGPACRSLISLTLTRESTRLGCFLGPPKPRPRPMASGGRRSRTTL
jgi:hypothetical protein